MKRFCHKQRGLALLVALLMLFSTTALAARYSTLEFGDRGQEVKQLQNALKLLGYDPSGTDGKFGRGTENAVKLYQQANKLEADGKAGHQTLSKLYEGESIAADGTVMTGQAILAGIGDSTGSASGSASGSGSATAPSTGPDLMDLVQNATTSTNPNTIKYGDSGYRVTELQTMLTKLGYSVGGIDGRFGNGTLKALVQFQKDNGLTPDGLCGSRTLSLIRQKMEVLGSSGSSAENGSSNGGSSSDGNASSNGSGSAGNGSTGSSGASGGSSAATELEQLINNAFNSTNPNTVKYGDYGSKVTEVQTLLTKLGYSAGGIDGRFGTGTLKALVQFQKDNKLTPDGLCGTQTLNLLRQKAAALENSSGSGSDSGSSGSVGSGSGSGSGTGASGIPAALKRTLYKGHTGEDVLIVQKKLKELGYYKSLLDGVYGNGTIAAVRAFQANNGLTADGLAGARTFKVMFTGTPVPAAGSGSGSGSAGSGSGTGSAGSSSAGSGSGSSSAGSGSGSGSGSSDSGNTGSGSSTGYTTLQYGSKGDAVRKLQTALKGLKYNVSADGDYGALTQMAVKAFQQCNGLVANGIADPTTQALLYSGKAKPYDSSIVEDSYPLPEGAGQASGPSTGSVKLLHWFNDIKPTVRSGQTVKVFDPATSLQWTLKFYSLGRHADSEPLTELDTQIMFKAFGYKNTWTPKPVYVQLPSGVWTLASMHNVPHLSGSIQNNAFDGHLCVHFLRDMDECSRNDPNYGVQNQKTIRKKWQEMTGQVVE